MRSSGITFLIVGVAAALVASSCSRSGGSLGTAPAQEKGSLVATKDRDKVIGSLKWTVTEVASGKVLSSGDRKIHLGDVSVDVRNSVGHTIYGKQIPLGGGFFLCNWPIVSDGQLVAD